MVLKEVQHVKVKQSGLSKYFKNIITSEAAGVKKPDPKNFSILLLKILSFSKKLNYDRR